MTDRDIDLIQAAAKAAGIRLQLALGFTEGDRGLFTEDGKPYDPLTSDADAFRLAVALRMNIDCAKNGDVFVGYGTCKLRELHRQAEVSEIGVADTYAATRRAIVRAAAALDRA